MAIQKKHGKGRLDKWYKLAKEKGYRARAAFKLIQLNKKYGFLEKSRVLLDLCAAPGSWCQVAAEAMPAGSLIMGVDLAPIKPIPRTITFQSDITTDKCRATIRSHMKHLKADTVLHDGAPNVGVAWVQDAFSQAELVLQSMKLATEFLKEGGTFVTKVFRSKDYNALLWVFKQLFTTVEATKPPSSRNVSAEIFVVCRGFKAPKRIDPKFLDPRHVFEEVQEPTPNNEAKVFNPEKKKRKREGYEEGDYTQHKVIPVSEFIYTTDPIAILGTVNRLSFEQSNNADLALETLNRIPETTEEIRSCCEDLKVLGRKDFRNLLRWRLKVRDMFGMSAKSLKKEKEDTEDGEEIAEVESMDEELKLQEELQRLKDREHAQTKKERRRENERKTREIIRMQLHMTTPDDIGLSQVGPSGDGQMFNAKTAKKAEELIKAANAKMEAIEESENSEEEPGFGEDASTDDEADRLDRELDTLYESYQQRKEENDAKLRAKKARKEKETDEWAGLSGDHEDDQADPNVDHETDVEDETLRLRTPSQGEGLSRKAAMFYDQDIFQDLGITDFNHEDSAIEMNDESDEAQLSASTEIATATATAAQGQIPTKRPAIDYAPKKPKSAERQPATHLGESDDDLPRTTKPSSMAEDPRKKNGQLDIDIITAEAMTLAHSLASGEKTSTDLIDDGFNKLAFRDVDGLPDWFLDDETKHSKQNRPITAAAAAAIREKLRALNARPIKKVREAKGRKKFKAAQRLEKLKAKSAVLADEEGMTEKDKAGAIGKMLARAAKKKPQSKVKVVVATGTNRGIKGRPKGTKGRYKIVDPRLKKDVRGEKRAAKRAKKKNN